MNRRREIMKAADSSTTVEFLLRRASSGLLLAR